MRDIDKVKFKNICQAELKRLFTYSQDSGLLTWNINKRGVRAGDKAGCVDSAGYIKIMIDGVEYRAARLAFIYMTGKSPDMYIDHINGDKSDNRWCNLRAVTPAENCRNQRLQKNNKSGINGVGWHRVSSKWRATIKVNSRMIHLGLFYDKFDAICARKTAEMKYNFHENHGV